MADDDRNKGSGGFDDWLEEEAGPDTDPYAALSDDDPEAEIADWMAFTQGDTEGAGNGPESSTDPEPEPAVVAASDPEPEPEPEPEPAVVAASDPEPEHERETEQEREPAPAPESVAGDPPGSGRYEPAFDLDETVEIAPISAKAGTDEATAEIPIAPDTEGSADREDAPDHAPATTVDVEEWDSGARADTDEIPIVAAADVVAFEVPDGADTTDDEPEAPSDVRADGPDTGEIDRADDTGEMEVVPLDEQAAGASLDEDAEAGAELVAFTAGADEQAEQAEVFDFTQEDYLHTATREHAGLAAAIAEADAVETERVALTAPIAGLESTVVGFEDVVEAEGHGRVRARRTGDLMARVITALVLIAALAASLVWRPALVALATVVFIIGAGEFYTALARTGRHPIALFGFVGLLGATIGAFFWGAVAIPTSFFIVATLLLLFYAVVPGRADPMQNLALTITVMVWVGLGSFAMLIADSDDYRPLVIGVVVTVAMMDIAQYFVGRSLGRHQLAPWVSPKKTVEGLVGGVIVALGLGACLHFVPPFELTSGLAIGAATAILVPLGDLAMSAAKRSLALKDMGSVLPGHGGFLDRIDGLLFTIPAAWAIFVWTGLL